MTADDRLVQLGDGYQIDEGAIVGYMPGRKVESLLLVIGEGARIRSGTVIYAGSQIGNSLETGHNVVIREENIIGDNFKIWNNSTVDYGCKIGNNVRIHNNVYVAQYTVIEDDAFLAPGVMIANDPHPICTKCMKGPTIKHGAKIGINVTLLPHVTVGENCLVGGGSVVTKDLPAGTVAYGWPAKVRGKVSELPCKFGHKEKAYPA